jgi:hypothetical protein
MISFSTFEDEVNNQIGLLLAILFLSPVLNTEYFKHEWEIPVGIDIL